MPACITHLFVYIFHDVINSVKLNKVQIKKETKQNIKSNKLKKYRLLIAERNENKRKTNRKYMLQCIVSCVCASIYTEFMLSELEVY